MLLKTTLYIQEVNMTTYLNTPQIARLFGVNIQTVRGYIRSGELPAARIGRTYIVSDGDLDSFVQARKESRKTDETTSGRSRKRQEGKETGK
jgi:excisionase family DNA binding protein